MENNFPIGLFPESIQMVIHEMNRVRKYPIDYLSGAIIWVVSVLIGATSCLETNLGRTYCNIYMMFVGATGGIKSRPLTWATKYLREIDSEALTKLDCKLAEYNESKNRGNPIERPVARRLLIDETTPEAIFKRLQENPLGIGQCADELKKAFDDLGRYAKSANEEVYLRLFNGDVVTIDRAHQDTLHVSRPFFSLSGTTQLKTFKRMFTPDRVDNGLLDRFLQIIHYEEHAVLWNLTEVFPSDVDVRYQNFLMKMLDRRETIDYRHPLEYCLTIEAAEVIQSWQNEHEIRIDNHGRETDRATFRKIQIYVLKFALIIQIMTDVESGNQNLKCQIDFRSATFATILADYFYQNAKDITRSVSERNLSKRESEVYDALPNEFTSEEGLVIAKRHGVGKTCYFELLTKIRGILIDQPARGHYVRRFPKKNLMDKPN